MASDVEPVSWYSIGAVARKTGISVHTLRAWERRYSLVAPHRSAGGTRLYSNADILRLRLLRRASDAGYAISRIAAMSIDELRELLKQSLEEPGILEAPAGSTKGGAAESRYIVDEILKAVELMDGERTHAFLMRAVVTLPVSRVIDEVIVPTLREVGERWAAGAICPANEHLLSVNVRRVLAWLTEAVPVEADAPGVIVTTPSGHWHELGAQIAGLRAAEAGWRVIFLGPNLPARDIMRAVTVTGASLVLLGVTMPEEDLLRHELTELKAILPQHVKIIVGGRGAEPYQAMLSALGVRYLGSFDSLTAELRQAAAELEIFQDM
jgi:MerR family transcriptional regulator, light-induced transcriptional regulator